MNKNANLNIPGNAPSIAGQFFGGREAKPMKQPPPKAVRRAQNRLAARRLDHSATLARVSVDQRGGYRTPGSQKK